MTNLYQWTNPKTNKHSPMISKATYDIIMKNEQVLNSAIVYDRDYSYNYFGFKVWELFNLVVLSFLLCVIFLGTFSSPYLCFIVE